jgi:hypothetical protein
MPASAGRPPETKNLEAAMDNQGNATTKVEAKAHKGSCHCGAVRFTVEVDPSVGGRCNCSVCTKIGGTGAIVKPGAFTLDAGAHSLSTYEWGGRISKRYFCRQCGIHCFGRGYLAELGGDYVSVNLNCLDDVDPSGAKLAYWDGRHDNWRAGTRSQPWPIFPAASPPRA